MLDDFQNIIIIVEGDSDKNFFSTLLCEFIKKEQISCAKGVANLTLGHIKTVLDNANNNNKKEGIDIYVNRVLIIRDADDNYNKAQQMCNKINEDFTEYNSKNQNANIRLEYYLICKRNQEYGMLENILIDYLNEDLMENSKKLAEDLGGIICKEEDSWQQIFSDITTNQDINNKKIVKSLATIFTNIIKKTDYNDFFHSKEMVAKLIESSSQCKEIRTEIEQKIKQLNLE